MSRRLAVLSLVLLAACGEDPASRAQPQAPAAAPRPPPRPGAPNVLLVVIDTLRADMLDPDEPDAAAMPALSRLAETSVFAEQASSASSWTPPSLASLITGLLPERSGGLDALRVRQRLDGAVTIAGALRDALGYRTAARFGGLTPEDAARLGDQFDLVTNDFRLRPGATASAAWARSDASRPWFQMLHTYEAHDPYGEANHPSGEPQPSVRALRELMALGQDVPVEELVRRSFLDATQRLMLNTHPVLAAHKRRMMTYTWNGLKEGARTPVALELAAAYRDGVRWVDGMLTDLLATYEREGLLTNTLVIVTSDHGEAFGEHGMLGHGRQLFDELVRVPLVMRGPPPFDKPQRWEGSVGLVDLLPTLLEWLGAPVSTPLDGASFLADLRVAGPDRPVIAQLIRERLHTGEDTDTWVTSVRSRAWKYVAELDHEEGTLVERAFDLRSDPEEQRNLADAGGRLREMPFDESFCKQVEEARNWLFDRAAYRRWSRAGPASVERPEPLCETNR
jgi:arylsulfatase A-like enzyme